MHKQIVKVIEEDAGKLDGYYIRRLSFFLGKPIYHCGWYPGYQLRLFRQGKGKFNSKEVHEYLEVEGNLGYLEGDMLHYTYDSINQYIDRMNRYTDLEVKEILKNDPLKKFKFTKWGLITETLKVFKKMYFKQKGYKDGFEGFLVCILSAFYKFIYRVKLWEKTR